METLASDFRLVHVFSFLQALCLRIRGNWSSQGQSGINSLRFSSYLLVFWKSLKYRVTQSASGAFLLGRIFPGEIDFLSSDVQTALTWKKNLPYNYGQNFKHTYLETCITFSCPGKIISMTDSNFIKDHYYQIRHGERILSLEEGCRDSEQHIERKMEETKECRLCNFSGNQHLEKC